MKILLDHISKRFQKHWIFKEISTSFSTPGAYALLGANGSGKSTLLRVIAGMQSPTKGKITYSVNDKELSPNELFPFISFSAPGQEIIEEYTLREFLQFHFSFKKPLNGLSTEDIIRITGLTASADKMIGDYSSGMKQAAFR